MISASTPLLALALGCILAALVVLAMQRRP